MKLRTVMISTLLASVIWFQACTVPAWVSNAESIAEATVPIAGSIVDIVDPAAAPVVTLVEAGFSALVKTLDAYKASPTATNLQAVQAAFNAVNANVAQLEQAAGVKNAGTATTVSAVVQLLTQAVSEIAALVPPAAVAATPGIAARAQAAKGWKAKDFKRRFNSITRGDKRFHPLPLTWRERL